MKDKNLNKKNRYFFSTYFSGQLNRSALLTVIGVILLFSTSILVTLIAPRFVDSTWTSPSSPYQVQMYEIQDPHLYLSSVASQGKELQYVHHLKQDFTLIGLKESAYLRFVSPKEFEPFITYFGDETLKLTSKLLMLREPQGEMKIEADQLMQQLQKDNPLEQALTPQEGLKKANYQILEIFSPETKEAFSIDPVGGILQNWVDENYFILDEELKNPYHQQKGVIYIQNPLEFRIHSFQLDDKHHWYYDPKGRLIKDLEELKSSSLGFMSRQELIYLGEHLYAIEGCWYCHTDQTRTLIQDTVLNGSDSYPAPPSSANEYIYQKITFAGTRRIGPDLSRVGVKRPSRDWHKTHFWSPKTAVLGSIMPAFRHFFDEDPLETKKNMIAIPNYRFEAIYQYMMTKGTRITPPNQAWWLGKDPIKTKEIIEGQRTLK